MVKNILNSRYFENNSNPDTNKEDFNKKSLIENFQSKVNEIKNRVIPKDVNKNNYNTSIDKIKNNTEIINNNQNQSLNKNPYKSEITKDRNDVEILKFDNLISTKRKKTNPKKNQKTKNSKKTKTDSKWKTNSIKQRTSTN